MQMYACTYDTPYTVLYVPGTGILRGSTWYNMYQLYTHTRYNESRTSHELHTEQKETLPYLITGR
jgi:hypothetical protein